MIPDLHILCIEDSEDDVILLRRNLRKEGFDPLVYQVTNAQEMRDALNLHSWDAVICDYLMPEFDVQGALEILQSSKIDLPFIIVSGTISDEAAVSMMRLGAHDYILKENLTRLAPAIRREMEEAKHRHARREAEIALKDSEMKHRTLVKSMNDIIFILDKDGFVTEYYSSIGFGEMKNPVEIPGKHIEELMPGTNAVLFTETAKRVLSNNQSLTFDSFYHIDGKRKWFSASLSPHEDGSYVVVVTREITELKEAEEEIRAAHRMATLYLDLLGHDVRNYLQAVMISADLIAESMTSLRDRELLDQITASIERCQNIITNVHSTSDLLSSPLTEICLCKSIKQTISEFRAENKDVQVEISCDLVRAPVNANDHIHTLLMNLLSNAIKHNQSSDIQIWIDVNETEEGYEVIVSDNGPGISDKNKETLFDPERRFGGVGIHQAKQSAEKFGGCISVNDRVDGRSSKGASFKIWLPKLSDKK
ncbi:MAG: ATP-binding protein [Candidatus Thorarchaeota archaeon]